MRYLNASELRSTLTPHLAIESMRRAFGPEREHPARILVGSSLFMPGRVGDTSGIKVVSVVPGSPAGVVCLFSADGQPIGVVDGPTLTAIRTGAASGLATDLLARADAHVMAMLGAGAMALDQIAAVRAVRPIDTVLVWSRTRERAEQLAASVGGLAVGSATEAVSRADVVVTATPATSPLFASDAIRPGTHVNAVGAFTPEMVELPPDLLADAYVVVDDRAAAKAEAGDLLSAGVTPDAEMGELLSREGAPAPGLTTVFKSVGIASQDIAAAAAALAVAEAENVGTVLS